MFEVKLNNIIVTSDTVSFTSRLYDTQGPISDGIGPDGRERFHYNRTPLIERSYTLNRPINRTAILTYIRNQMEDYNAAHGTTYQPSDFYVNISAEATGLGA